MKKFLKKVMIVLSSILALTVLVELFVGGRRFYNYNCKYSIDERLDYLCETLELGLFKTNDKIMKQDNIKVENVTSFPETDGCTFILSTKDYNFKLYFCAGSCVERDVYDKTNRKKIQYYSKKYYYVNRSGEKKSIVSKKTTRLINKELNAKLTKVGHDMSYQIFNPWLKDL